MQPNPCVLTNFLLALSIKYRITEHCRNSLKEALKNATLNLLC